MSARKRRTPPRCGSCRAPIRWLQLCGRWQAFELRAGNAGPAVAYPVLNRTAWLPARLTAELMRSRACTRAEAEEEVADLDWHAVHVCRRRDDDAHTGPQPAADDQETQEDHR